MKNFLLCMMLAVGAMNAAPIATMTLDQANLTGVSGDVVGWGFTLHVDTGFFVVVTGSNYVTAPLSNQVGYSSGVGTFISFGPDIIGNNNGPDPFFYTTNAADWQQPFLWTGGVTSTGVRAFQICGDGDPTNCPGGAPALGMTETGTLTIDYQYGDGFDGELLNAQTGSIDLPVSITVGSTTGTPEPGTWVLLGGALIGLAARRRFRG